MSEPKLGVSLDDEEAQSKRDKMDLKNAKAREKRREKVGFGIRCLGSMKDAKEFLNKGLPPKRKYTRKNVGEESSSAGNKSTKRPKSSERRNDRFSIFFINYLFHISSFLLGSQSKSGHLAQGGSDRSRPAESLSASSGAGIMGTEENGLVLAEPLPDEKSLDSERSEL